MVDQEVADVKILMNEMTAVNKFADRSHVIYSRKLEIGGRLWCLGAARLDVPDQRIAFIGARKGVNE
jgi:hypothetical protein